jgi:hypothetical protein
VNVLAGDLYLGIAVAVTWPIALHLQSWIFGRVPSDLTGGLGLLQELVASDPSPFPPGGTHGIDAPQGLPTWCARDLASFPSSFIQWVLAMTVGPIAPHTTGRPDHRRDEVELARRYDSDRDPRGALQSIQPHHWLHADGDPVARGEELLT